MSKRKKKFGLQKDFSSIFEGVWIPPKGRAKDARTEPSEHEPLPEDQEPLAESQEAVVEAPESDEREQPGRPSVIDEPSHARESEPAELEDSVSEQVAGREERAAVEMPLSDEQPAAEDTDDGFTPNPEIEKIIRSMKCSKGFICYRSNFQQLCKVKYVGEGKIIECSPLNQGPCAYRFSFMGKVFCKCPLRYYIARNLGM